MNLPGQELLGYCFFSKSTSEQFPCTPVFFILTSFKLFNSMLPDWLSQSDKKTKQFYAQSRPLLKAVNWGYILGIQLLTKPSPKQCEESFIVILS